MRELLPEPREIPPDPCEVVLRELYAFPGGAGVRANMITSLDGAASGADGTSSSINNEADHRIFQVLRSLVDAVIVGAGTVRAEGYANLALPPELTERRLAEGLAAVPTLVVVSSGVEVLSGIDDSQPVVLATTNPELRNRPNTIVTGGERLDFGAIVKRLAEKNLTKVQLEGGPGLLGQWLGAGLVDQLCLSFAPLLQGGDGGRIAHSFAPERHAALVSILEEDSTLLTRWDLSRDAQN